MKGLNPKPDRGHCVLAGQHELRWVEVRGYTVEACKVCWRMFREVTVSEKIMRDLFLGVLRKDNDLILRAEAGARKIGQLAAGSFNNENNTSWAAGARVAGVRKNYRLTRTDENAKLAMMMCARGDFNPRHLGQKIFSLCCDDWKKETASKRRTNKLPLAGKLTGPAVRKHGEEDGGRDEIHYCPEGTGWTWLQKMASRQHWDQREIAELLAKGWKPGRIKKHFQAQSKK
jgi:hypothetical protein